MATTRLSRPVSLSLALHGALVLALLALGIERRPAEPPRVLEVVWIEGGLPDLAATRHGDEGLSVVADADPAAVPMPEASPVEPEEHHQPAPTDLDADNTVAAADRPAPAPADEPTDTPVPTSADSTAETAPIDDDSANGSDAATPSAPVAAAHASSSAVSPTVPSLPESEPAAPPEPAASEQSTNEPVAEQSVDEPSVTEHSVAETDDEPAPDTGNLELEVDRPLAAVGEIVPGVGANSLDAATAPIERTPVPERMSTVTPPTERTSAITLPTERTSATPSHERRPETTRSQPLTAEEQARMREEILDRLARSRDLASQPSLAWSRDGREYRAELTRVRAAGAMGIEEALLELTTNLDGRQVSTEVRLKRLAFSHYAQLIDRWDPSVQIHDDVIDGRFHSNSEILIENSGGTQPVFHGKVTTAGGIDTSRSTRRVRRDDVFLGGLDTRSPRIVLPRRFVPIEAVGAAHDDDAHDEVIELDGDTHVIFRADGSYLLRAMQGGETRIGRLSPTPTYFVAADKTTVGVKGTLNGKVLVYSPREIVIEGDLVYASDPIGDAASGGAPSDDYLGLVSDGTIEVAAPDITGEGDVTIHAAIYAKGRFAVRRFSRGERATLTIYGSLSAGSLTATEPRFRTKLVFDPRLEETRPPSFPMTDRYEIASWDGVWHGVGEE